MKASTPCTDVAKAATYRPSTLRLLRSSAQLEHDRGSIANGMAYIRHQNLRSWHKWPSHEMSSTEWMDSAKQVPELWSFRMLGCGTEEAYLWERGHWDSSVHNKVHEQC